MLYCPCLTTIEQQIEQQLTDNLLSANQLIAFSISKKQNKIKQNKSNIYE